MVRLNPFDLLLPKETKFFTMLTQQANNLFEASKAFENIMLHIHELEEEDLKKKFVLIKEFEKKGDLIERQVIEALHKTFLTPIDREDIHLIVINVDKALDILNSLTRKIEMYAIHEVPVEVYRFCEIIVNISEELFQLMSEFQTRQKTQEIIRSLHNLEKRGDDLFHQSMANLFNEKNSAIYIIKFKEVFELLEAIIDAIDFVGKIVRGILVKAG